MYRPHRATWAFLALSCSAVAGCGSDDGGTGALAGTGGYTGPVSGSGGVGTGGTPVNTGGVAPNTGGASAFTGGTTSSGGVTASGGSMASGGTSASGGASTSGGTTGSGGATSSGGSSATGGATSVPTRKPPCLTDPKQLVLIGDSYINWISHTFPADINAASGLNIEDFAIGGTSMGSGGIGLIPAQFDTALQTHPNIKSVIMDGGGNDVLVADTVQFPQGGDCNDKGAQSPSIPDCQKIVQKALDAGTKLFLHMADKGVQDAVFFFYPHVPTGTLIGGTDPNGMLDYALPKIKAACDGAYETSIKANPAKPLYCHFVDMVPVFQGQTGVFADGDIHPNSKGSKLMAAAIWDRMKKECIAQPASSGCCEPQ